MGRKAINSVKDLLTLIQNSNVVISGDATTPLSQSFWFENNGFICSEDDLGELIINGTTLQNVSELKTTVVLETEKSNPLANDACIVCTSLTDIPTITTGLPAAICTRISSLYTNSLIDSSICGMVNFKTGPGVTPAFEITAVSFDSGSCTDLIGGGLASGVYTICVVLFTKDVNGIIVSSYKSECDIQIVV